MPITSADPFGGVILTDWNSPPETPNERFKMQVYILGRVLAGRWRSGFPVPAGQSGQCNWRDASVSERTGTNMENAILLGARQIRRAATADE